MRRLRNEIDLDEQEVGRWLISYADFITLLFAFFVVMYSISQVNSSKYKILAQALEGVFDNNPRSTKLDLVGIPSKSLLPVTGDNKELAVINSEGEQYGQIDSENFASTEAFKDLENGLEASLGDLIDQELAEINSDANWINIVLKSGLLFPSGSDLLNAESNPLMEEVAEHLNSNLQLILVHGHTDNIPIATEKFPSNWELSSARGVAVVRKLQSLLVQPNRMSVEGHGEYQPMATNNTVEGRRKNRRVVISISRKMRVKKISINTKVNSTSERQVNNIPVVELKETEPEFDIIRLPGGGVLIRGKDSRENDKQDEQK